MRNKIYGLIFFVALFFGYTASASVSQFVITTENTSDVTNQVFQKLGTGLSMYVEAFRLKYHFDNFCGYGYTTPYVSLVECPDDTYTTCTTKMTLASGMTGVCDYDDVVYFQDGVNGTYLSAGVSPYQMNPSKYYYIRQYTGYPTYGYGGFKPSGAMSPYESWTAPSPAECNNFGEWCTFDYLYFSVIASEDIYLEQSKVSRLTPRNGDEHLQKDVQFTGFYSNTGFDQLKVNIYNRDLRHTENVLSESASTGIGLPFVIDTYLNNGNYSYFVYLYNTATASTSWDTLDVPYYFTVGTTTPFLPPYRTFDMSEEYICAGIATSTGMTDLHLLGDIECALKKGFAWAFYPDQQSMTDFAISYGELKNAFPFNAFFDLTDTVTTAIASSTTGTAGTIKMPFINNTGDFITLDVVSSTSVPNLIGTANNTLFRNTITYILWALAGVLVFFTIKTI